MSRLFSDRMFTKVNGERYSPVDVTGPEVMSTSNPHEFVMNSIEMQSLLRHNSTGLPKAEVEGWAHPQGWGAVYVE